MASGVERIGFSVLGRSLEAGLRSAALERWLSAHWYFAEHDPPAVAYRIEIEERDPGDAPAAPTGGGVHESRMLGEALQWRNLGDVWHSGTPAAGVRLVLAPQRSRITVWGAESEAADRVFAALYLALCEAVRASGLLALHASVAVHDGGAAAFLGRSGTGKSTTLLQASRAGWHPLAEDFAWLEPQSRTVFGWDRGIRLWPEGVGRLPRELAEATWETGADGKRFLPFSRLAAGSQRSAVLTDLVLLERDAAARSAWEPLAPRDAVRAVWECVGVPLAPATRAATARWIPRLLHDLRTVRLRLGSAPLPFPRFPVRGPGAAP